MHQHAPVPIVMKFDAMPTLCNPQNSADGFLELLQPHAQLCLPQPLLPRMPDGCLFRRSVLIATIMRTRKSPWYLGTRF